MTFRFHQRVGNSLWLQINTQYLVKIKCSSVACIWDNHKNKRHQFGSRGPPLYTASYLVISTKTTPKIYPMNSIQCLLWIGSLALVVLFLQRAYTKLQLSIFNFYTLSLKVIYVCVCGIKETPYNNSLCFPAMMRQWINKMLHDNLLHEMTTICGISAEMFV